MALRLDTDEPKNRHLFFSHEDLDINSFVRDISIALHCHS